MRKKWILFILFIFLVSGCAMGNMAGGNQGKMSGGTHILEFNRTYSPISSDKVTTFLTEPRVPNLEIKMVGLVEAYAYGFGSEQQDLEEALQRLKEEAAAIGANGLIITYSNQETLAQRSVRRLKGRAIRYRLIPPSQQKKKTKK